MPRQLDVCTRYSPARHFFQPARISSNRLNGRSLSRAICYGARRSTIEFLRHLCRLMRCEIASGWQLSATTMCKRITPKRRRSARCNCHRSDHRSRSIPRQMLQQICDEFQPRNRRTRAGCRLLIDARYSRTKHSHIDTPVCGPRRGRGRKLLPRFDRLPSGQRADRNFKPPVRTKSAHLDALGCA